VWHLPTDKNALTGKQFIGLFSKEMNVKNKYYVMPLWLMKLIGIFVPVLKEMPEMMYQFDRDYFFDSSKFEKRFKFIPTTYQEGIRNTVQSSK
jgi:hypothetical protein